MTTPPVHGWMHARFLLSAKLPTNAKPVRVDLIVTDVAMQMDGLKPAERLSLSPGGGSILPFISGYDLDPQRLPDTLLGKPFGLTELVAEVTRLLSQILR